MKLIVLVLLVLISGCTDKRKCENDLENCVLIQSAWEIQALNDSCEKLATCMKMDWEIVQFSNQSHNPYACSIWKHANGYRRAAYFYPKGDLSFGTVRFNHLDEAITTCEMVTGTGDKSKEYYEELKRVFKAMDKERDDKKTREYRAEYPAPKRHLKIRVDQPEKDPSPTSRECTKKEALAKTGYTDMNADSGTILRFPKHGDSAPCHVKTKDSDCKFRNGSNALVGRPLEDCQ